MFGVVKGLLLGGLLGVAMVAAGQATPAPWLAYLSAALAAIGVAPIAGRKIWQKDGLLQFGLKSFAGALLGPALLWLLRRFGDVALPEISRLPGIERLPGFAELGATPLTLGSFSLTSLALVSAIVAGFYDLDNTDAPTSPKRPPPLSPKARLDPEIAALTGLSPEELDAAADETSRRRTKG